MKTYKNKYRTTSNRLKIWDYSESGWYFITICTRDRERFFGNSDNGEIKLTQIGKIADKFWKEIPMHFENTALDKHVIMPNHTHGILIINKPSQKGGSPIKQTPKLGVSTGEWKPATIGVIINQYKRIVTINARKLNIDFAW
jgi:hypothetical protein